MDAPSEEIERLTAYHEAGHAVMALVLGRAVHRVSIEPNTTRMGECKVARGAFRPSKDPLETDALVLLAGVAAEARFSGRYAWEGAIRDLRQVRSLARSRAGSDQQAERLERRWLDKAEYLLEAEGHWQAVLTIASQLLEHRTISGRAARHHFDQAVAKHRQ